MTPNEKAAPARTGAAHYETTSRARIVSHPDRKQSTWCPAKACGDAGELAVAGLLRRLGLRVHRIAGFHPGFDLKAWGSLEIKTDALAERSGFVAAEVAFRGKPSGVTTSTADGWCFIVGGFAYFVPLADLRALLDCGLYRRVNAGDAATVELVPLADLAGVAVRIPLPQGVRR